jgi:hypothetical protein
MKVSEKLSRMLAKELGCDVSEITLKSNKGRGRYNDYCCWEGYAGEWAVHSWHTMTEIVRSGGLAFTYNRDHPTWLIDDVGPKEDGGENGTPNRTN